MRRIISTVAISVLATTLISCGSDDSTGSDDNVGQLIQVMVDFGGDEDEAACVAEELDGVVSPDELEGFLTAFEADDRSATSEEVATAFATAAEDCGLL